MASTLFGKRPSTFNPNLCNACETFAMKHQGGAEVELSLLFVDVRGSTTLAESKAPREFRNLINRLYVVASHVLVNSDALIDKLIGDQVAGTRHASAAIQAA